MCVVQVQSAALTDEEALSILRERIKELMGSPEVQSVLRQMKHDGVSEPECQSWLVQKAVATLAGVSV